MNRARKTIAHMVLLSMLAMSVTAQASEGSLREVFQDAVYGGAIGVLVGGAITAFTKKPVDHLENLGYGGAVGILAGTAYGLTRTSRSLAEIDGNKVRIAMPTIYPSLSESPTTRQTTITWYASILRGTFH